MEPGEINRAGQLFVPYEKRLSEIAAAEGCEVTVERLAIKDMGIPRQVEMCRILDRIDASIEQKRPVYVHCLGGIGRTGTTVGCYLVRRGLSGAQSLAQLAEWWKDVPKSIYNPRSPETDQQVEYILNWDEH
jgi:protein tyrosine phosphatase